MSIKYPPNIDWEVTGDCNHSCIHCYNAWRTDDKSSISNLNENYNEEYYVSIAKILIENNVVSVQVTGGEPLLVFEKIKKALKLLSENNIRLTINTNATILNNDILQFVLENNIKLFISLPSFDRKSFENIVHKASYDVVISNLDELSKNGVDISINMVISKLNINEIYDTAKFVKERYNQKYFSATKASFPMNASNEFLVNSINKSEFIIMLNELLKVKRELNMKVDSAWVYSLCGVVGTELYSELGFKRKCECGRYSFVLSQNGEVKACGCDKQSYGNIFNTTFEDILKKMSEWYSAKFLPNICRGCVMLEECGGGCRADARNFSGRINGLDSTAEVEKLDNLSFKEKDSYFVNGYYTVSFDVKFIQEYDFVRIDRKGSYEYVTLDFYNYLMNNNSFSLNDLIDAEFDLGDNFCELSKLVNKGFIVLKETLEIFPKPYNKKNKKVFVNPYFIKDNDEYINKYNSLPLKFKRYSK